MAIMEAMSAMVISGIADSGGIGGSSVGSGVTVTVVLANINSNGCGNNGNSSRDSDGN